MARYCQMRKMSSIMSISRSQTKMERDREKGKRERETEEERKTLLYKQTCTSTVLLFLLYEEKDDSHNHHHNIIIVFFSFICCLYSPTIIALYKSIIFYCRRTYFVNQWHQRNQRVNVLMLFH